MRIRELLSYLAISVLVLSCPFLINYANSIELVQEGYYEVFCNDLKVSQHATDRKAYQTAINSPDDCYIDPPRIRVTDKPVAVTTPTDPEDPTDLLSSIELTWDIPKEREDGSNLSLDEIKGYVIYYGTSQDSLTNELEIEGPSTVNYILSDLNTGTYYFSIATKDSDGITGAPSPVIEQSI